MSAHLSPTPFSPIGARRGGTFIATARLAWQRFARAYAVALRTEVSRRNLGRLDDRMLGDIGISRAQAAFEADRKPWRQL